MWVPFSTPLREVCMVVEKNREYPRERRKVGCAHDFEYNNINELNFCYAHIASIK